MYHSSLIPQGGQRMTAEVYLPPLYGRLQKIRDVINGTSGVTRRMSPPYILCVKQWKVLYRSFVFIDTFLYISLFGWSVWSPVYIFSCNLSK
jgi:hypothetical protein